MLPKKLLEALENDRPVDLTNAAVTYQAMIYKVEMNEDFAMYGWDYTGEILFESQVYDEPSKAVLELSFCEPSHPNWFETFRTIVEGEVIDEQIVDTSVIEFDGYGEGAGSEERES